MFGNRNDFNFNFLFGNNNFMSPNQNICRSAMSDPKPKNPPSKIDTDKTSPEDNINLTDMIAIQKALNEEILKNAGHTSFFE